jgi:hypothetical protein
LERIENLSDSPQQQQQQQQIDRMSHDSLPSVDNEASNMSTETNESISSRPNIETESSNLNHQSRQLNASESRSSLITTTGPKNYAPQLKFSEDGRIIINEESLVIQRENVEPVYDDTVVENEQGDSLTYTSYRKHHHTKKWTERETAKFYKALSMIGTDFTMIQRLFPNRSRDEIKRKFKREEKLNQALIDRILSKTDQIELSVFVSSSDDEQAAKTGTTMKKGPGRKKSLQPNDKDDNDEQQQNGTENKSPEGGAKKQKLKRIRKRKSFFVRSCQIFLNV